LLRPELSSSCIAVAQYYRALQAERGAYSNGMRNYVKRSIRVFEGCCITASMLALQLADTESWTTN